MQFFQLWWIEKLDFKVQTSFSFSLSIFFPFFPSPSTHLLLPSSSYPWLTMMVSLFLTHIFLKVASPITVPPSPFCYLWSSRRKILHWWKKSKAYKLYMKLHYMVSKHLHLSDAFLLPLSFTWSIHFNSLFFIVFSFYLLQSSKKCTHKASIYSLSVTQN